MRNILLALGVLISVIPAVQAEVGSGAHGGHPIAGEFVVRATEVVALVRRMDPAQLSGVTAEMLEGVLIPDLIVDPVDAPSFSLNGRTVCFLNETQPGLRIQISIPCWIQASTDTQLFMSFHELLGLLGIERDHYAVSSQFYFELLRLRGQAQNERWSCPELKCGVFYRRPENGTYSGLTVLPLGRVAGRTPSLAFRNVQSACQSQAELLYPGLEVHSMVRTGFALLSENGESWAANFDPVGPFNCRDEQRVEAEQQ